MMRHNFSRRIARMIAVAGLCVAAMPALGQYREDHIPDGPPIQMPNPAIVEKPNAMIPKDLVFTRSDGVKVKLGEMFNGKKPVILSLVYFSCPNLCGFAQDSLVKTVLAGPRSLKLGEDYDIVVVSIDPDDTPAMAAVKRGNYLRILGRPESQAGFTYLTGSDDNVRALAETVGFGYRQNFGIKDGDAAGKFAHSSGIFVCTPFGILSQTIVGLDYPTDKVHYALLQAADGKIGSGFLETIGLSCGAVHLGPHGYENNPWFWAGTTGGGATVLFMAIFLGLMWRGEWKKHKSDGGEPPPASPAIS